MNYLAFEFYDADDEKQEILVAYLAEAGFEMFEESCGILSAYLKEENFDEQRFEDEVISKFMDISYSVSGIARQNWNEVWEKNFEPMQAGDVYIRAPFHESRAGVAYELIIEPKMSFGTGHHATTTLMVLEMQKTNFSNRTALDMGCGTSLLAILASKMGAKNILAIDVDDWAVENSNENCARNNVTNVEVLKGDAASLTGRSFDVILANINRNVLLADMEALSAALLPGGEILFSGFYESDMEAIQSSAAQQGLQLLNSDSMNQWAAMRFSQVV